MFKNKSILITLILIVVAFSIGVGVGRFGAFTGMSTENMTTPENTSAPTGQWIVKAFDSQTKKEIENFLVVVTDLDKKFEITKSNNIIDLPPKPASLGNKKYPYGYTLLTYAKGYLPRIDHNMTMGLGGGTTIELELPKPEPLSNQSYVEEFHGTDAVMLGEFFQDNLGNIWDEIYGANNQPAENTEIKGLVYGTIEMQYLGSSEDMDKLYTPSFLQTIKSDTKFYKTDLCPYYIVDKNYMNNLKKINENEYTVSVAIEDKKGRYIQVIHIIKQNGNYLIANIEYDI